MTLIMTFRGRDFLALASDRRLTANGRLIDDAANKATIVTFPGGQLACGYTGLAVAGRFRTQEMLEAACREVFKPPVDVRNCLKVLRGRIDDTFSRDQNLKSLRAENRRLAVAVIGFAPPGGPFYAEISNFDDLAVTAENRSFVLRGGFVPNMVGFVGYTSAVDHADLRLLISFADRHVAAKIVIEKLVETIRRAAARSSGNIGTEITSVVLRPGEGPNFQAHFLVPGPARTPAVIMGWEDGRQAWMSGMEIGNSRGEYGKFEAPRTADVPTRGALSVRERRQVPKLPRPRQAVAELVFRTGRALRALHRDPRASVDAGIIHQVCGWRIRPASNKTEPSSHPSYYRLSTWDWALGCGARGDL
jgi:hypothetical protein